MIYLKNYVSTVGAITRLQRGEKFEEAQEWNMVSEKVNVKIMYYNDICIYQLTLLMNILHFFFQVTLLFSSPRVPLTQTLLPNTHDLTLRETHANKKTPLSPHEQTLVPLIH